MFREAAIATLTITGVGILLHALIARGSRTPARGPGPCPPWARLLRGGSAIAVLACVLGLAVTGLYSRLVLNAALSGYLLIVHVSLGGGLAAALAVFAVAWAWDHGDLPGRRVCKAAFWLMVIAAIPAVLAVLLNMFPLWGTDWQGAVVEVHRVSALICTVCGAVWGYLTARGGVHRNGDTWKGTQA